MSQQIYSKLDALRQLPYGLARTTATEEIVRQVEANGPESVLPLALLNLVEAYDFGGEGKKSYAVFAKLLRLWDTRPELFDDHDTHALFWQFKWVSEGLASYPEITKQQAAALLSDMEKRFALAGKGMMAPRVAAFQYAFNTGQANAEELRLKWLGTPDDEFNDCPACTIGLQTDYFASTEQWQEAVAIGRTQNGSCNIEPTVTHHILALAELMAGNPEAAAKNIKLAGATLDSSVSANGFAAARGMIFEALGRGGSLPELLRELRTKNVETLEAEDTTLAQLRFLLGLTAGLAAALNSGADPEMETGLQQQEWRTLGSLHSAIADRAKSLATKFDTRNENDMYSRWLRKALAASVVTQLPRSSSLAEQLARLESHPPSAQEPTASAAAAADQATPAAASNQSPTFAVASGATADATASAALDSNSKDPAYFTRQLLAAESLASRAFTDSTAAQDVASAYLSLVQLAEQVFLDPAEKTRNRALVTAEAAFWAGAAQELELACTLYSRAFELLLTAEGVTADTILRLLTTWGMYAEQADTLQQFFSAADSYAEQLNTQQQNSDQGLPLQNWLAAAIRLRAAAALNEPAVTGMSSAEIIAALLKLQSDFPLLHASHRGVAQQRAHLHWLTARLCAAEISELLAAAPQAQPQKLIAEEKQQRAITLFADAEQMLKNVRAQKAALQVKNELLELLLKLDRNYEALARS